LSLFPEEEIASWRRFGDKLPDEAREKFTKMLKDFDIQ
jgi:hypothetical protein